MDSNTLNDLLRYEEDPELDAAPEQESDTIETQLEEAQIDAPIKLDYTLKTCEERAQLVERIVQASPAALSNRYLEILGDYIMGGISKEERKSKQYLTDNRLITVNRRETSFEGLVEKFENGEDGIYNLITNDKNVILVPKISITEEDVAQVPGLSDLREAMAQVESASKEARGRKKYLLKKQLIEMRKDQYILKNAHYAPMQTPLTSRQPSKIALDEQRYIDENGDPQSTGLVSFFNPEHISALLQYYTALKLETHGHFHDDFYYLLDDFDTLLKRAFADQPVYQTVFDLKMAQKTNAEIAREVLRRHGESHSAEFISTLWRQKIPRHIAEVEAKTFLYWYYTNVTDGPWKTCSCCKERKPANHHFFTRNKTSKDNFYSLCKDCRKKKR